MSDVFMELKELDELELVRLQLCSTQHMLKDKNYKFLSGFIDYLRNKYNLKDRSAVSFILTQVALTLRDGYRITRFTLDQKLYCIAKKDKYIKCGMKSVRRCLELMQRDGLITVYKGCFHKIPHNPIRANGIAGGVSTIVEIHDTLANHIRTADLVRYVKATIKPLHIIKDYTTGEVYKEELEDSFVDKWNKVLDGKVSINGVEKSVRYNRLSYKIEDVIIKTRFYSGSFQTLKAEYREFIQLGNEDTVELDFSCCQPSLLAAKVGLQIPDDHDFYYTGLDIPRDLAKSSFLALLYGGSESGAIGSVFSKIDKSKDLKKLLGVETKGEIRRCAKEIIEKLLSNNKMIRHLLYNKDGWLDLQNTDSMICELVVGYFIERDIPVLGYHDSFRVPDKYKETLREVMRESWEAVVGNPYNCKIKE